MTTPKEDGIYYDIPEAEYRAWDAVSHSGLKILCDGGTTLHYKGYVEKGIERTPAMDFGRLAHQALLEPDRLGDKQPLPENIKRRAGKDYEKLLEDNPGVEFLPPSEWEKHEQDLDKADKIRESVMSHPKAIELMTGGKTEVSLIWTDVATGLRCKARVDYLTDEAAVDIKTTDHIGENKIKKHFSRLKYYVQVAFYSDGLIALKKLDVPMPFYFVAVEKHYPYLVSVHDGLAAYHEETLEEGQYMYYKAGKMIVDEAMQTLNRAIDNDDFEGYPMLASPMILPKWFHFDSYV